MTDEYGQEDQEAQEEGDRYILENRGPLDDEDYERAYVSRIVDEEEAPDEETFSYVRDHWDRLDPEERKAVMENLSNRRQKELRREYGTLQGMSDLREYSPDQEGLDDEEFKDTYENWEDLDTEQRRAYWQNMNGEQKKKIKDAYSNRRGDEGENWRDWTVTPEQWQAMDPEEQEELWYNGKLSLKERQRIDDSDEYSLEEVEMDPSRYEDESWYNMTASERVAIVESDEYEMRDFGKTGYLSTGSDGSLAGMLTGTAAGTATIHFTWPMITSGNPETMMTGLAFQTASSIGGYSLGSLAGMNDLSNERRYAFGDDEVAEAYEEQQLQEEEDDEPEAWNFIDRVSSTVRLGRETEEQEDEDGSGTDGET
ncbi:MAG: hypothetical protein SVU32_03520 [Candidatus Nanohaloarchaea archaeon]|nr:hypothetical protein [Candidatus Nanohaloarchaea archaeon]